MLETLMKNGAGLDGYGVIFSEMNSRVEGDVHSYNEPTIDEKSTNPILLWSFTPFELDITLPPDSVIESNPCYVLNEDEIIKPGFLPQIKIDDISLP
jgi:hypothetical protein